MDSQEIALNNTQSLLKQIAALKVELALKDLHIAHLASQVASNNNLQQNEHCGVSLEQSQQSMHPTPPSLPFVSPIPDEIPPSNTLTLDLAAQIQFTSSVVQLFIGLDLGEALCCIFWNNIMSSFSFGRQQHDLNHGAAMVYQELACGVQMHVWIFKLQQYKVIILLLWEGPYRLKNRALEVANLEWQSYGQKPACWRSYG